MMKPTRGLFAVLLVPIFGLSLVASSAGAVPHDDHVQPARDCAPADSDIGQGRGNPNGSNGTIKIDGADAAGRFDCEPNNEPHIAACFQVDLYGFDEGDTATLSFKAWPPTGKKTPIPANLYEWDTNEPWDWSVPPLPGGVIDIGEDGAGGGVDVDNQVVVEFIIPPGLAPHPQHGYHVKLDAQITSGTTGKTTNYKKTKVFWVSGECTPPDPSIDVEKTVNGQDADTPPGPSLAIGSTATFDYTVTNNGDIALDGIMLDDNVVGALTCPETELAPGESMDCTSTTMDVEAGQQFMEACVKGFSLGRQVDDCDPVYYTGVGDPSIDVEKFVNGQDADNPPGPSLPVGSTATFTYVVTNNGDVPLTEIALVDNVVGALTCPETALAPGASMDCTSTTMDVEAGQQFMEACVTGMGNGTEVDDCDPVYYTGTPTPQPTIDIEKSVNGEDADNPPGPTFSAGQTLKFRYVVTNTGDTLLTNIKVIDSELGDIGCVVPNLGPGGAYTCPTVRETAVAGEFYMTGTVTGDAPDGTEVTDVDPVNFVVVPPTSTASIDIEKSVNGEDADNPPGPTFSEGQTLKFRYVVTNNGDTLLTNIKVIDSELGDIGCVVPNLGLGGSYTCPTVRETAVAGQFHMTGTATGDWSGGTVTDIDPVNFTVNGSIIP